MAFTCIIIIHINAQKFCAQMCWAVHVCSYVRWAMSTKWTVKFFEMKCASYRKRTDDEDDFTEKKKKTIRIIQRQRNFHFAHWNDNFDDLSTLTTAIHIQWKRKMRAMSTDDWYVSLKNVEYYFFRLLLLLGVTTPAECFNECIACRQIINIVCDDCEKCQIHHSSYLPFLFTATILNAMIYYKIFLWSCASILLSLWLTCALPYIPTLSVWCTHKYMHCINPIFNVKRTHTNDAHTRLIHFIFSWWCDDMKRCIVWKEWKNVKKYCVCIMISIFIQINFVNKAFAANENFKNWSFCIENTNEFRANHHYPLFIIHAFHEAGHSMNDEN